MAIQDSTFKAYPLSPAVAGSVEANGASKKRLRVAIFVYSLHGGGAQRVGAYLANGLDSSGDEVLLITELGSDTDQYPISSSVRRSVIGIRGSENRLGKFLRMARKVIRLRAVLKRERPDMLVAFMTRGNNLALLAARGLGIPVIICERNDPRFNRDTAVDRRLRKHLYPRADLLIAQTPMMERVMRDTFGIANTETIPNPCALTIDASLMPADPLAGRGYILGVGRLTPQKGFDTLIRAYARSEAREALDLVIAGFGGELPMLEQVARDEGVADRVHFIGYVAEPYPLMLGSRLFVLSSRFEGFPNVLLEAMRLGRPVVSTMLPSGSHAMIEDGVSGLLVPVDDDEALAAAIDRIVADPAAAEELGKQAVLAVEPYHLPVVIQRWRDVLAHVTPESAR